MVDQERIKATTNAKATDNAAPDACGAGSTSSGGMMGCGMGKKGLKGMLLLAACCGVPLLIFLAPPLVGSVIGGLGASALSTVALLACPVGMALMMWMMMRAQRTEAGQPSATASASTSEPERTAFLAPRDTDLFQDILASGADARSTVTQADADTSAQRVNGQTSANAIPTPGSSDVAPPPPA